MEFGRKEVWLGGKEDRRKDILLGGWEEEVLGLKEGATMKAGR